VLTTKVIRAVIAAKEATKELKKTLRLYKSKLKETARLLLLLLRSKLKLGKRLILLL